MRVILTFLIGLILLLSIPSCFDRDNGPAVSAMEGSIGVMVRAVGKMDSIGYELVAQEMNIRLAELGGLSVVTLYDKEKVVIASHSCDDGTSVILIKEDGDGILLTGAVSGRDIVNHFFVDKIDDKTAMVRLARSGVEKFGMKAVWIRVQEGKKKKQKSIERSSQENPESLPVVP